MDRTLWSLQLTSLFGLALALLVGNSLGALAMTIQLVTVVILASTLMLTVHHQRKQMQAQLLKDSFEMYWRTYEPVSDAQFEEVVRFCEDYFDRRVFTESYANDPQKVRRYLHMSKLYEYFAYSRKMHALRLQDPFGPDWLAMWTRDLADVPEFRDVHEYYRGYYPEFAQAVDSEIARKRRDSSGEEE